MVAISILSLRRRPVPDRLKTPDSAFWDAQTLACAPLGPYPPELESDTMKLLIVLSLVVLAVARPNEFYDVKYESFDVDEMTNNDRLLKAYALCFIGDGKCTAEGSDFKKWIPEAVQSSCGKCTEKQKVLVAKALKAIKTKLADEYVRLNKIHNPNSKYDSTIEDFLAKYAV
ncbi:unnamed protein product [Arctia plantaginis]|uniref:Chemosensory protein n=1 Tax=Arctia plantaginis TaxID=874455 RepID=A0A8S0ZH31_ARCPL|nr:unnamed protein product [Arctia plantaginis]